VFLFFHSTTLIHFRCQTCAQTLEAKQVQDGHERLTGELKTIDRSNPSNLEDFLKKYVTVIPESHQLSREIQYSLVLLYKTPSSQDLPTHQLLKKAVLCQQLLDLADILEPGMTKWRGQIIFELQSANVVLTQRALEGGRLTKNKAQVCSTRDLLRSAALRSAFSRGKNSKKNSKFF
jgi:hypothetical protein